MPMPTSATKTNCDASTDDPKLALLTDLAGVIDKFNALLAMYGVASGFCELDSSTLVPVARIPASIARLADPTFTGVPAAPTATAGTSTTQLATTAFVQAAIAALSRSATVRHTVLGGPVDSSGYPAPGGSTGGTSITTTGISASAPFVVGFANGFGAAGEVNYFGISTTNLSWSGLSTNGIMYLYVDYNAGGLTTGATTLQPNYQNGGTYSVTSGQATFNITEMVMKVGDGAAANQTNRVFVGEVTVAGGVVTAITWYAYRGEYVSPVFSITSNTSYSYNHNIGVPAPFLYSDALHGPSSSDVNYEYVKQQAEAGTVYGSGMHSYSRKSIVHGTSNISRGYVTTGGIGTSTHAQIKVRRAF